MSSSTMQSGRLRRHGCSPRSAPWSRRSSSSPPRGFWRATSPGARSASSGRGSLALPQEATFRSPRQRRLARWRVQRERPEGELHAPCRPQAQAMLLAEAPAHSGGLGMQDLAHRRRPVVRLFVSLTFSDFRQTAASPSTAYPRCSSCGPSTRRRSRRGRWSEAISVQPSSRPFTTANASRLTDGATALEERPSPIQRTVRRTIATRFGHRSG